MSNNIHLAKQGGRERESGEGAANNGGVSGGDTRGPG